MKKSALLIAAIVSTIAAAPAYADISAAFTPGGSSPSSGASSLQNFDACTTALCPGLSGNNYVIQSGTDGNGAQPAFSNPSGTSYLSVMIDGSATYMFAPNVSGFQFDWGSIDTYNTLTVNYLNADNSAGQIVYKPGTSSFNTAVANGDQTSTMSNGLFTVAGSAGEQFTSVNFANATPNAFEVDNLAQVAGVPEPATWALMLVGFGMVGFGVRRRVRQSEANFDAKIDRLAGVAA